MKQPKNRYFKLPKKYKVLDIGGGDHPHPRANVVEKRIRRQYPQKMGYATTKISRGSLWQWRKIGF